MRLRDFQKRLLDGNIDFALFFDSDANLTYFAGVKPDMACLAVPAKGRALLFVPGFEAERMARSSFVDVVKVERDFLKVIHSHFEGDSIGVVSGSLSYLHAGRVKDEWNAELVDVGGVCRDLRVVKTKDEIARITKACAIADVLFDELCKRLPFLKTELDAASFLKLRMSQLGFEPSFAPIVASGKNGATPHHIPTSSRLNGFTVLDFGIVYKNYCSDITRTVFIGSPSGSDRKVYSSLLKVQEDCIRQVVPGKVFDNIDSYSKEKVGRTMIHRVGHSLGVEVHDVQPRPWVLEAGNVVTIEPGTYPGKFGIRIEDDVLVTEKGPVLLTRAPKSLAVIRRKV